MLGDDRRELTARRRARAALVAWRELPHAEQVRRMVGDPADAGPPGRDPGPPLDEVRLALLAELCPCGSGPCGCGTGPPRSCGHPDRPAEVRRPDCLRCRSRAWWESGVEPGW